MVNSATNNRQHGTSFKSKSPALLQVTNSGNTRLNQESDVVLNVKQKFFEEEVKVALFSAKNDIVQGSIPVSRKVQIPV